MLAQVPQLDGKQAALRAVSLGHMALGLGPLDFSLPVGDIMKPGLNNLKFHIASLIGRDPSVRTNPIVSPVSAHDSSRAWQRRPMPARPCPHRCHECRRPSARAWDEAPGHPTRSSRGCGALALEVTASRRKNYPDAISMRYDIRQYSGHLRVVGCGIQFAAVALTAMTLPLLDFALAVQYIV